MFDNSMVALLVLSLLFISILLIAYSRKVADPINENDEEAPVVTLTTTPNVIEQTEEKSFKKLKVSRVIDGDTVIASSTFVTYKIRLDSIDCPESGQEWGDNAKYGLIKIIGGKDIYIEEHTIDCYDRTVATIFLKKNGDWFNVNERMVTLGHAWVMRRFYEHLSPERKKKLNDLERWAKNKKIGLWKNPNPIPPWNWRKSNDSNKT